MFYLRTQFYVVGYRTRALWVGHEYWRDNRYDACYMRCAPFSSMFQKYIYQVSSSGLPKNLLLFMNLAPNRVRHIVYQRAAPVYENYAHSEN
jgi:hypothetical protein